MPTLIEPKLENTTLYYRAGSSDKVYQCRIEPAGERFVVNFAYGRRGLTLNTGTKTNVPVDYDNAQRIFHQLVKEKQAKGYTPGEDGTPYQQPDTEERFTGILPQLLNPIDEHEVKRLLRDDNYCAQEKFDGRIFASGPNADWLLGNSIIALDPLTGNYDARIPAAVDPGKLAVADDGQFLYAGINSDGSIQRFNLATLMADLKFPTGFGGVNDMGVLPGSPHAVAVTAHTTFAVYDDGIMRPNTVAPGAYNFSYYMAISDTNTLAYEGMPDGLRSVAIDSSGATASGLGLISSFDDQIHFDAGRLYTAGGEVIDPMAAVLVTNLPYSGLVFPDSGAGKIFYLTTSGSTGTLHAVNVSNFVQTGTVTINNISGTPTSLITWGTNGLAFRTTGNQVFLIRTILADDRNNDGLPDSWQLQYFGSLTAPGSGPNDDPDHDGLSNLQEYQAGSNPLVADSLRFLSGQPSSNGGFLMTFRAIPGQNYVLSASTNLTDWVPIWSFASTSNPNVFVDPLSTNFGRRFYHIGPP